MSTVVDILINPVTLRFSYHNNELIYLLCFDGSHHIYRATSEGFS